MADMTTTPNTTAAVPTAGAIVTGRDVTMGSIITGRVVDVIVPPPFTGDASPRYRVTDARYDGGLPTHDRILEAVDVVTPAPRPAPVSTTDGGFRLGAGLASLGFIPDTAHDPHGMGYTVDHHPVAHVDVAVDVDGVTVTAWNATGRGADYDVVFAPDTPADVVLAAVAVAVGRHGI